MDKSKSYIALGDAKNSLNRTKTYYNLAIYDAIELDCYFDTYKATSTELRIRVNGISLDRVLTDILGILL